MKITKALKTAFPFLFSMNKEEARKTQTITQKEIESMFRITVHHGVPGGATFFGRSRGVANAKREAAKRRRINRLLPC